MSPSIRKGGHNVGAKSALRYTYNQIVNAWCMYDWGSSAFSTTVEAAVLPVYFEQVVAAGLPGNTATVYWGYTNAVSLLIVALLAPILGSIADYVGGKKRFLAYCAVVGILATGLMVFVDAGDWALALVLFLFAAVGLGGSYVFSDSLLPHVARTEDIDYVSSKGYALGYVGGGILLAVNIVMIQVIWAGSTLGPRLSLLSAAIWWAIFTVPLMQRVPEPPANTVGIGEGVNPLKAGFRRLGHSGYGLRGIINRNELDLLIGRSFLQMLTTNDILCSIGEGLFDKVVAVVSGTFDRNENISVFHKPGIGADFRSIF